MNRDVVLVTGATGFIGSHVSRMLANSSRYKVIAIVRGTDQYKNTGELSAAGVTLVKGLFYSEQVLKRLFDDHKINYVIHIAALRGAGKQGNYDEINVEGTKRLLEVSFHHEVRRFIFCSSVGVFGTIPREVPASTETRLNGDTVYHKSKILAEEAVKQYIIRGLDACIVRPTITYGMGDDGFPATLVKLIKKGHLFLPAQQIRIHLLDVKSLAALFCSLLMEEELHTRVMTMADESPILLDELANIINRFYFGSDYPDQYRMPSSMFRISETIFKLLGNEKWSTRLRLISRDWFYDVSPIRSIPGAKTVRTEDKFLRYLEDAAI